MLDTDLMMNFREGFIFAKLRIMRSFAKMKPSRNGEINMLFTDINRSQEGGGGGTLIFSSYVGSGPASALQPQKISGISSTPEKYLKF